MTVRVAFKQSDVERACKGVKAAGFPVSRVEVENGKIIVVVGDEVTGRSRRNPLDRLHAA